MIERLQANSQNASLFCEYHYSNQTIWQDSKLIPDTQEFIKRKHDCFENAGQQKGKGFCDEMYDALFSRWTKNDLYSCYEEQGVEFQDEFCQFMFPLDDPNQDNTGPYADCMIEHGKSPSNQQFCDIKNSGIEDRMSCYDQNEILNYEICMLKETKDWTSDDYVSCFMRAGYTVSKEFC